MNALIKYYLLICLFTVGSCASNSDNKTYSNTKEKDLLVAVNKFNEAFEKGDVATLETMITDNYLHTNSNSKPIKKTDWLNYLRGRKIDLDNGILEVLDYSMNETTIEFHNDMAVVSARISTTNRQDTVVQTNEYRVTNVWVNENGNWKRAAFHDGKIK